ncbi:MAG: VWA domain-containing protein [Ignavibacteria bacterium]|nr:VWA domain-containing protein [Ignavibacteria bacterium]MCU7503640.1 VWA domain-containing protein [Ignavibacteria bacterium]MCU7517877.1 VWA domain-containing protein [Ignavibacteria bacterium]
MTFAYPHLLYLLAVIPLMMFWYFRNGKNTTSSIRYSSLSVFGGYKPTLKEKLRHTPAFLRMGALALFIVALARPQTFASGENVYTEGIDIAMVLDISGTMLAEDFKPNRIEAAKKVISDFIEGRTSDKIGLVIFSYESFTQCPLTIDYPVLKGLLKEVKGGMIQDGTAIGTAIANGVNRLKDSKGKSKVIILLTDGVNNAGEIDPVTAAQIAKTYGVRIYAIGVGTMGEAPYPFQTPFGIRYQNMPVEIDEATLRKVAGITEGKYFRATNNKKLEEIYQSIDKMEKTRVEVTSYRNATELYYGWLAGGLILLLFEIGLSRTVFRKIP